MDGCSDLDVVRTFIGMVRLCLDIEAFCVSHKSISSSLHSFRDVDLLKKFLNPPR